jgi:hypothetical protein
MCDSGSQVWPPFGHFLAPDVSWLFKKFLVQNLFSILRQMFFVYSVNLWRVFKRVLWVCDAASYPAKQAPLQTDRRWPSFNRGRASSEHVPVYWAAVDGDKCIIPRFSLSSAVITTIFTGFALCVKNYMFYVATAYCHVKGWLLDGVWIGCLHLLHLYSYLITITDLHTSQFTATHTLGCSAFISRILATDFNWIIIPVTLQIPDIKSSLHRLTFEFQLNSQSELLYDWQFTAK